MRIAHIADTHLGYSAGKHVSSRGVNLRELDGYRIFHSIVSDIIKQESIDLVLIAGDLFHTPYPSVRSIIHAQDELRRLAKASIPVYCLSGNHDAVDVRSEIAANRIVNDTDRRIFSYVEPYTTVEPLPGLVLHMVSHHMYAEQEKTMMSVKPVPDAINILSTHGAVNLGLESNFWMHTDKSPREVIIPDFVIEQPWDYTMMGHIHSRGWVGSQDGKTDTENLKVFYSGSILRRGFADSAGDRGYTIWEIGADGEFSHEFRNVAQRPQADFVVDAANMPASEITDRVVSMLRTTQTNGVVFDAATAPIVRCTIENATPSQLAGIDHQNINRESAHTLTWQLRSKRARHDNAPELTTGDSGNRDSLNTDLVSAYDSWVAQSSTVSELVEEIRDRVVNSAKNFIEMGQNEVLSSD